MRSHRNPSPRNLVKVVNRQRMIFAGFCLAVALLAGVTTFLLINFGRNEDAKAALGTNMGFENSLNEWTNTSGIWTVNTSATYIRTGTRSAKAAWSSGGDIEMKNANSTITTPSTGTNRIVVVAYAKSNNANGRLRLGIVNTATNQITVAPSGYQTLTNAGFTRVTAIFNVSNNTTYAPHIAARGQGGSTEVYVDDVHIYTTTLAAADETAPGAPSAIGVATSGNNITLNWTNATDGETGIDGVTVLRYSGAYSSDQSLNNQATYHATNTAVGPTTVGSWKVVYQGGTVTTITDNPGNAGIFTYLIYMRDKALNYTVSTVTARALVLNGSGQSALLNSNISLDGLNVGTGCTFTNGGSSTLTLRSNATANIHGTFVHNGTVVNNGTINVKQNGTYKYDKDGGALATCTWETGATCEITGTKFTAPSNLSQTFHHFIWNCDQVQAQELPAGITTKGNLHLLNSGPGASERVIGLNGLLTIGGNFYVSSAAAYVCRSDNYIEFNGTSLQTIQVVGAPCLFNAFETDNAAGVKLLSNLTLDSLYRMSAGTFDLNGFTFKHENNATLVKRLGTMSSGIFTPVSSSYVYNLVYERGNTTDAELTASNVYLNNLTLDAPANESVTLNKTAYVNGTLTLNGGKFITAGYEINVRNSAANAVSHQNENSYVCGNLRRNVVTAGTQTYLFPVGSSTNPQCATLTLNNLAGPTNILAYFTNPVNGAAPNCWVNGSNVNTMLNAGFWTITPDVQPTSGFYDITVKSKGHTNPVSNAQQYCVLKRENSSSPWKSLGTHANGTQSQSGGAVTAKRSALDSFSDFGIAFAQAVLPITLSAFNATLQNDQTVRLTWSTSAEINNAYFSLERSVNGVDFEIINEQEGAGNSTALLNYAFTDAHPVSGTNYYRLKQVDFDGTFTYGPVRQVTLNGTLSNSGFGAADLTVYPNPSTGVFSMHATSHVGHGLVQMKVMDTKGQLLLERSVDTGERTQLDLRDYPSGMYMASFTDATGNTVVKQLMVERR